MTAADLPNAFPYFIAIQRMVEAGVAPLAGMAVLAGYALIYCVPCIVLLTVGGLTRERTTPWLQRLVSRFSTGTIGASPTIALVFILAGLTVASLPFWI